VAALEALWILEVASLPGFHERLPDGHLLSGSAKTWPTLSRFPSEKGVGWPEATDGPSPQAVRNASGLSAQAGRLSGVFLQAKGAGEVHSVRVKAILDRKSSKRVQTGEPQLKRPEPNFSNG
jgi:hypothetical protein